MESVTCDGFTDSSDSDEMRGLVSDIQRFSVHDGPGIRTTVFLKGCNLRCHWCHNPETLSAAPELQVFPEKCINCEACLKVCERGAHQLSSDGQRLFRRELCVGCGACARTCYAEALVLVGRRMTAEQVFQEVLQDRDFYRNSGGGVTLSGGEPLFQQDFVMEILRLCRAEGMHTAVETNMAWPWKHVEPILPLLDLVMMDIKVMDDALHREWTGTSNQVILDNAVRVGRLDTPLIVRTPVICGVNDDAEQIGRIAEFIAGLPNLQYFEPLPYHPLGSDKYRSLGLACPSAHLKSPGGERMRELVAVAATHGISVRTPDGECVKGRK